MSSNNNSIKIDDIQIDNLDSNNQTSSFNKKKIDINTTTQSDNVFKDFLFKKNKTKEDTINENSCPKIPWYKNYKTKRIIIFISIALLCTLIIAILVVLLLKSKQKSNDEKKTEEQPKPNIENNTEINLIPEITENENEPQETKPKNETKTEEEIEEETKTEEDIKIEEKIEPEEKIVPEEEIEKEEEIQPEEEIEPEEEEIEKEEEILVEEEEIEVEEEKKPVYERINLEDINIEEVNTMIGGKAEENHKMINDSLNNIDEILNNIETIKSEVVNKINFDPNNLTIPSFLTDPPSDSEAHKMAIAKEDVDLYNEKYKELSEKTNDFSQKTSDSINEITEPVNNLKKDLDEISEQFEETMKNLCLPLILEQKGLIDTSESNLRRLEIDEIMEEYKKMIQQFNELYNKFLNFVIQAIDYILKELNKISSSACELNDYINEGISNFTDLIENTDINNVHNDLIKVKSTFLKLKNNLNERKNKLDESISNFENLNKKMESDLLNFQNHFDDLTENITEISNLIIEKTTETKKIELKNFKNCSNINIDSIKSIFYVYQTIIKIQFETKERLISIEIIINVEMKTSLDLLFIMDLTGSMGGYINEAKRNLINIMDRIIEQSPGIDINLGFIGYRDIPQEEGGEYIDIDFTQNHTYIRNKIQNVFAALGGDLPEDVAWAFERALNKTWKSNAKFIVFVADAPGHGTKYYPNDYKYRNGIAGRKDIEESVEELAKDNVSMFCLNITVYTNTMFNIFKNVYNKYESTIFKLVQNRGSGFTDEVVNSCIDYYSTHRDLDSK